MRPHVVPAAADQEFWKRVMPGQRILIWYRDDDVYHERVALWPTGVSGTTRWAFATPDHAERDGSGIYVEDAGSIEDVSKVAPLSLSGKRPYLDEDIYAFADVFSNSQLLDLIRKGRKEALEIVAAEGGSLEAPTKFVEWNTGRCVDLPADLLFRGKGRSQKQPDPGRDRTRSLPSGRWAAISPLPGIRVGDVQVLKAEDDFTILDNFVLLKLTDGLAAGQVAVLERLDDRTSTSFRAGQRKQALEEFEFQEKPAVEAASASQDDARTMSVTTNRRGRRHKHFQDAVDELVEDHYDDWPLRDRVRTLLHLLERMSADGLAPIAWIDSYLARKRYPESDRSSHELRAIAQVLETALLYDQVNVTSLACFEYMARRLQLIVAAHAVDVNNPAYAGAEFYGGNEDGDELVSPELRKKVLEGMKSQAKVLEVQQKQKELKTPLPRNPKGGPKGGGGGKT